MGTVTENILRICYTDIYGISIARYIKSGLIRRSNGEMMKFIHKRSRARSQPLTRGNSKIRRKNSMGTVTQNKKEHIYI